MNALNPYLKEYKKTQVETATPEKILILLYDGAIQYLNRAKVDLEQGNEQQFHSNLLGCEKIIVEFMNTLDMETGGSLAENLYRLYEYLYNTLVKAGISRKPEGVNEVLKHLNGLRETWQKAIEISNAEKKANLLNYVEEEKSSLKDTYDDKYVENDDDEETDEDNDSI
jgi:flagellar secretion chaperone FliS